MSDIFSYNESSSVMHARMFRTYNYLSFTLDT